jgi:methyl coenzyme M reductase subunit D
MNLMSGLRLRNVFAIFSVLSLGLLNSSSLAAASKPGPAKSSAADADYTRALAAADRFLQAWQGGDIETGTVMLTTRAKEKTTRDELDRFFSSSAPAAYQIERGKFLRRGRYAFPIVLLSDSSKKPQRKFSNIIVRNTGNDEWAVDKLP